MTSAKRILQSAKGRKLPGYFPHPTSHIRHLLIRRLVFASSLVIPLSPAAAQKRVILFIGDGVGVSYWTAARLAAESLAVAQFRTLGLVDTRASNNPITDSGAGATAYSAGVRTFNGAIGVGPDSQPVESVLEAAKKNGWATGLVATSSITDATPASFAAHVPARAQQFDIARHITSIAPDVVFGGGARWFDPSVRPDRADLIGALRTTHTIMTDTVAFSRLRDSTLTRVVGLFAPHDLPPAATRAPTLPAMTQKAIEILSRDPDGFFLMVEGSQADWRGHSNLPIGDVVAEMLDFDAAIGVALAYQRRQPDVLIIVTSDHETGGLAIETARDSVVLTTAANSLNDAVRDLTRASAILTEQAADSADSVTVRMQVTAARFQNAARNARAERIVADYTTGGHTGQLVPLFASGPGAASFAGMIDNYRVGQLLLEIVRRPATPVRRRRE